MSGWISDSRAEEHKEKALSVCPEERSTFLQSYSRGLAASSVLASLQPRLWRAFPRPLPVVSDIRPRPSVSRGCHRLLSVCLGFPRRRLRLLLATLLPPAPVKPLRNSDRKPDGNCQQTRSSKNGTGRIFKVGIRKHATSKVKKCE